MQRFTRKAKRIMSTTSPGLIVSLTSYGPRIQTVWNVIMQMLSQTKTPDLVVLHVSQKVNRLWERFSSNTSSSV